MLQTIFEGYTKNYSDFVYTFLGHFYSALKKVKVSEGLTNAMCDYLSTRALPEMVSKSQKYCKVTETLLKLTYRLAKQATKPLSEDFSKV